MYNSLPMRSDEYPKYDMNWMCFMSASKEEYEKGYGHDVLCICMWLKGLLIVFSSHWNRYVGGIVSLRYNVGNTVPLGFWYRW